MIYFNGFHNGRQVVEVYCALVNLEDVIGVVIGDVMNVIGDVIQKDLQTHLLICHPLHVSVYKLKLQLLTYNTSEKYLN